LKLDVIIPVGPGHQDLVNEAIQSVKIAVQSGLGAFTEVKIKAINDTKGTMGRSAARNAAIDASEADWLFFLDADDLMHPDALKNVASNTRKYDAIWGSIMEYKDGCIMERFQMPYIDKFESLLEIDPYYTIQMGFFVKREKMEKFDEEMNTGEDWKLYLSLWKKLKCVKINHPFMANRRGSHSHGPKSANGRDWGEVVRKMIAEERNVSNSASG